MELLSLRNVSKYFSGLKAVDDVSLTVDRGDIVSIIGPNGAGKTTLFNVISGHYTPTKGEKLFDGKDITGLLSYQIVSEGITRTFQNIRLFSNLTVLENVMIGLHTKLRASIFDCLVMRKKTVREENECFDRAMEFLKQVGLDKKAFETARNLAYGEQRRLEIVRALASEPTLLLLDEPTAGMNIQEALELVKFIKSLNETGLTILLIEHNMKVVMGVSKKVIVLDHGVKIAEGSSREIQNNKAVIEAYLGRGAKHA